MASKKKKQDTIVNGFQLITQYEKKPSLVWRCFTALHDSVPRGITRVDKVSLYSDEEIQYAIDRLRVVKWDVKMEKGELIITDPLPNETV